MQILSAVRPESFTNTSIRCYFLAVIHLYHRWFPRLAFRDTAYKYPGTTKYRSHCTSAQLEAVADRFTLIKFNSPKTVFIVIIDQIHNDGDL